MDDEKRCGTCRYWGVEYMGICSRIPMNEIIAAKGASEYGYAFVHVTFHSITDVKMDAYLETTEDFGCRLWRGRNESK